MIEAESLTMRINRTLGTQAKLRWFPAINVPCNINVRASGQGVPKDRLCAALGSVCDCTQEHIRKNNVAENIQTSSLQDTSQFLSKMLDKFGIKD